MKKKVDFPNIRAELAKRGMTLQDLVDKMIIKGLEVSPSALSNKLNRRRTFYSDEM